MSVHLRDRRRASFPRPPTSRATRSRRRATRSTTSASIPSPSSTSLSRSTRLSASSCRWSSGRRRSTRARFRPRNTSSSRTSSPASTRSCGQERKNRLRIACAGEQRGGPGTRRLRRYAPMRLEYFEMIDRVAAFDREAKRIEARSTVPGESPVFEGHFPGHPARPGRASHRDHGAGLRLSRARARWISPTCRS